MARSLFALDDVAMIEARLPVHLAYHYLGCAEVGERGLAVPGPHGPWIEGLADRLERVSVLAYEPRDPSSPEDRVDYLIDASSRSVSFESLGPKGTWLDLRDRRARVQRAVERASRVCDVLVLRLPNRRVDAVWRANRCSRTVSIVGGHSPSAVRESPMGARAKARARVAAFVSERALTRALRGSGLSFANSETLVEHYRGVCPNIELLRTSSRFAKHDHSVADRMDGSTIDLAVVGRVSRAKGIFDAIRCFASVRRTFPNARLHIVGDGEDLTALRAWVHREGLDEHVVIHGWVAPGSGLFDLYRRIDVLLHLSYAESLPRVIWDAMAHSVLVVCTPVGGVARAFRHEIEALHVPPRDECAATEAVVRLAHDPDLRGRLLANGYERAREATVEATVGRFVDALGSRWPSLIREAGPTI